MKRLLALAMLLVASPAVAAEPWVPWAPTAPAEAKVVRVEDTDHDDVRLRIGAGYFGRFDVPLGREGEAVAGAQMVGVRVWFRRSVGLDVAAGFHVRLGSKDSPSALSIAGRVSLPVALAITRHATFFLAPTIGYGQGGETSPGGRQLSPITGLEWEPPDTRRRGLRATVGGRLGAELHLGFIGVSRLSLTASVGLDFDLRRGTTSAPPSPTSRNPQPQAESSTRTAFVARTTFSEDALSAALGNVAVVAYF